MKQIIQNMIPQARFLYKTVLMIFFITITFLFFRNNLREKDGWKRIKEQFTDLLKKPWIVAFLVYVAYVFSSTIMGRYLTKPYNNILKGFGIVGDNGEINTDLFVNVLMFIPLSFLYLKAFQPKKPVQSSIVLSACSSVFIELSQLIGWLGNCQLSDILYNTIGGLLGCCIWYIAGITKQRRKRKIN